MIKRLFGVLAMILISSSNASAGTTEVPKTLTTDKITAEIDTVTTIGGFSGPFADLGGAFIYCLELFGKENDDGKKKKLGGMAFLVTGISPTWKIEGATKPRVSVSNTSGTFKVNYTVEWLQTKPFDGGGKQPNGTIGL